MPESSVASVPTFIPTQLIPIDKIKPSPYQARKIFDEEAIRSLARSIELEGQLQPIVVRLLSDGLYELIAGERRWRAFQLKGWIQIEAKVVTTVSEAAALAKGLAENLQRRDLNPIEEAQGYAELNQLDGKYWTQARIAEEFGISQSDVSQSISLLSLPEDVKAIITRVIISKRHGVALAKLSDKTLQSRLGQQAAKTGWSVKELENKVKKAQEVSGKVSKNEKKEKGDDPLSNLWADLDLKAHYKGGSKWGLEIDLGKAKDGALRQAMADLFQGMADACKLQAGPAETPTISSPQF